MSDYKLELELKQYAPIIHFQHDHQGVTLRASEVKPKLDRFLIEKLGGKDKAPKEYFIDFDSGNTALNYKMRFEAHDIYVTEPPKYGLYYGNMGGGDKAMYVDGGCKMTVLCFNSELLSLIKSKIREFFVVTNFGRMQDKGFGSYVVKGQYTPENICRFLANNTGSKYVYYFDCDTRHTDDAFNKIKTLYSVMKSGYNINGTYHRSFLFEYFHHKNIGNEKAYLKKEKISPWTDGKPVEYPNSNRVYAEQNYDEYLYVRAMLGVGDHVEYIKSFNYNQNKRKYLPGRDKETVKIQSKDIERFPSPVFFKVIDDKVYFVPRRVDTKIFDKEFVFSNKAGESVKLKTPADFDIDDFLEYFHKNYNPREKGYGIQSEIRKYTAGGDGR